MLMYEALGLCGPGEAGKVIDTWTWRTNKAGGELCHLGQRRGERGGNGWVVNASGGLLSKGA